MAEGKIFSFPGPEDPRRNRPTKSDVPPAGKLLHMPRNGGEGGLTDDSMEAAGLLNSPASVETVNFFLKYHAKVARISQFLRNLEGYTPAEPVLAEGQQSFQGKSLEDLGIILDASDEKSWKEKPAYFQAVLQEISTRVGIEDE